jgi:hypothetical protein
MAIVNAAYFQPVVASRSEHAPVSASNMISSENSYTSAQLLDHLVSGNAEQPRHIPQVAQQAAHVVGQLPLGLYLRAGPAIPVRRCSDLSHGTD